MAGAWVFGVLALVSAASAGMNGLGKMPLMGWNTWCTSGTCGRDWCSEEEVLSVAKALVDTGMRDLGWNYVNLDDCWEALNRSEGVNGSIQADPDRFPHGISYVTNAIHSMGMKFGIYTSAGEKTCSSGQRNGSVPGSYLHYQDDVNSFASWGVDYVKMDWCSHYFPNGKGMDQETQTLEFAKAMNQTTRAMWFNFHCDDYPKDPDGQWCAQVGNSYRIHHDHHDDWDNTKSVIMEGLTSPAPYAGPFAWPDPDFLMTGGQGCGNDATPGKRCPGMTDTEYITEFCLWVVAGGQLLLASDPRNISSLQSSLLLNKEAIDIFQDPAGKIGSLVASPQCSGGPCMVFGKPLGDGGWALAFFNAGDKNTHDFSVQLSQLDKHWGSSTCVDVRDVLGQKDWGQSCSEIKAHGVAPHGTLFARISAPKS